MHYNILFVCTSWSVIVVSEHPVQACCIHYSGHTQLTFIYIFHTGTDCLFVCWSLTSLCHSNGHIETEKLIPLLPWPGFDLSFSGHNDRRAITASGHDYALDRSAIGAGTQEQIVKISLQILCATQNTPNHQQISICSII